MIRNKNFEIVNVADEYMAVPIGEEAVSFHGVVALSEAAAFLLNNMDIQRTKEELIDLLQNEYEIDTDTAKKDIDEIISTFNELKLVSDS